MSPKYLAWSLMIVGALVCQSTLAADTTAASTDKVDKNPPTSTSTAAAATTSSTSSDYGIPQNLMQVLTNGGAVAVGLALVAAVVALSMPMFGIRYCQLLGNCDASYNPATSYSANSYDMYSQYPQPSYSSGNTYQKRSVDYMGPVLHLLKTAYDKYGQQSLASSKKVS